MIPHRPPFKLRTIAARLIAPTASSGTARRLEQAYSQAVGCTEAVWLPSARAGIYWALLAATRGQAKVVAPAFTCSVVHEAIVRSGCELCLIDSGSADFLMDEEALRLARSGVYALVLSEPYGHAYEFQDAEEDKAAAAKIRIFDSAMAISHRSLFDRLEGNDFAVVSFAAGKTSYSGWGGMGFTRDTALADEVRRLRDSTLQKAGIKLTAKRIAQIVLRTVAHQPAVHSATLSVWKRTASARQLASKLLRRAPQEDVQSLDPAEWLPTIGQSPEWMQPSTYLDRGLALWNLQHADSAHAARLENALRYNTNLAGRAGVDCPPSSRFGLSHYTVRVDARIRNAVGQNLKKLGVDTRTLWSFNPYLSPEEYPNTSRLCAELLNLPNTQWMTPSQIDAVSERLLKCIKVCMKTHASA